WFAGTRARCRLPLGLRGRRCHDDRSADRDARAPAQAARRTHRGAGRVRRVGGPRSGGALGVDSWGLHPRPGAKRSLDHVTKAAFDAYAEVRPHVTIDEIARRADVGYGTMFRRFTAPRLTSPRRPIDARS